MRRRFTPALLLLTGFTISACTAILVPDQDDDGVERCNNTDDCKELEDNRYVSQCVKPEGLSDNSDSICAASVSLAIECGGTEGYGGDHPLSLAFNEALAAKAAYGGCETENFGKRGCPPVKDDMTGARTCNDGLEISDLSGVCDDPNDPIPAIYPPDVGGPDIAGQDAMDQFCRWYFCDETFVCDTSTKNPTCQPCSGNDPEDFGSGGCGQIYIEGEPSSFYTSLDNANCSGNKGDAAVEFGPAPTP